MYNGHVVRVGLYIKTKTHLNPKLILNFSIPPTKPTLTFHLVANNPIITHVINRSEQVCVVKKKLHTSSCVRFILIPFYPEWLTPPPHTCAITKRWRLLRYVLFTQPTNSRAKKKAKEKKSVIPCHERKKMICSGKKTHFRMRQRVLKWVSLKFEDKKSCAVLFVWIALLFVSLEVVMSRYTVLGMYLLIWGGLIGMWGLCSGGGWVGICKNCEISWYANLEECMVIWVGGFVLKLWVLCCFVKAL